MDYKQTSNFEAKSGSTATISESGSTAPDAVGEAAAAVREQGERLADRAKHDTTAYLASKKDEAASTINDVAEATRQVAQTLRDRNDSTVARCTEAVAAQAESFSRYLREHQPADVLHDLQATARKHPAVVYGGLFLAGLALSRFLKASDRS